MKEIRINDKLQKKLHLINFTVKMLIAAAIVFVAVQLIAVYMSGGVYDTQMQSDNSGFYGHNYCGTFFIDITRDNSFIDEESYLNAIQTDDTLGIKDIFLSAALVVMIISLLVFFDRADKQTIFKKRTAWLLLLSGGLYAAGNTISEIESFNINTDIFKGAMATQSYYPQLYAIYGIPFLIIVLGLVLLYHEQTVFGKSVSAISRTLKAGAWVTGTVSLGFIIVRFSQRVYELINSATGGEHNARLPFYSAFITLPRSEAVSDEAYTKVLLFRFIKDMPVFIASSAAVIVLLKFMYSAAEGYINTEKNLHRLKAAALALAVSSLIFNLMGLTEVTLLCESFAGIFGDVTYTIGIRSFCEPMLYAFILLVIELYIQTIPPNKKEQVK